MKDASLLCLVCFLFFNSCKKADTPTIDTPVIDVAATAKLVIVTGRVDNDSVTFTSYSDCITAYNADGTLAWKNANIGNGFTEYRPYYSKGILYFLPWTIVTRILLLH